MSNVVLELNLSKQHVIAIVSLSLVVIIAIIWLVNGRNTNELETLCLEKPSSELSPSELSRQLNIPLVTFDILPDDVADNPQSTLYLWYANETPECGISTEYFNHIDNVNPSIEIRVKKLSTPNTDNNRWMCLNYNIDSSSNTELKSVCSKSFQEDNVFVSIVTVYDETETRRIVEDYPLYLSSEG